MVEVGHLSVTCDLYLRRSVLAKLQFDSIYSLVVQKSSLSGFTVSIMLLMKQRIQFTMHKITRQIAVYKCIHTSSGSHGFISNRHQVINRGSKNPPKTKKSHKQ